MSEKPVRIVLFEDRPNTVLVHVPEGGVLELPECRSPFNKDEVAIAASKAGLDVRVSIEPRAGRWTTAIVRRVRDQRAEKMQRSRLQTETAVLQLQMSDDPILRDRARLIAKKQEVDEQLRLAKIRLGEVKGNVRTQHKYISPREFRALEQSIASLQGQSLGIQGQLGAIKKTLSENKDSEFHARNKRFVDLAKQILDADEFAELIELAQHPDLPDGD